MRKHAILHRFEALAVAFLLALMLAACANSTSTQQGAVALPSAQVDSRGNITSPSARDIFTLDGNKTQLTPALPPTSTPLPLPTSTPEPTATPMPTLTPTPTPSGVLEKVDKAYELGLIKKAYDDINANLFKEPDNATILNAALTEVGVSTGETPASATFTGNKDQDWDTFAGIYNATLDKAIARGWKFAKGDLAHRVIDTITFAVNDGHTYFMNEAATQNRENLLTGNNTSIGFGIVFTTQDNKVYVVRVVPNAPAEKAGMKAGDQLVAYDDQPINDKNYLMIRDAKENESHNFTISRAGGSKLLMINVTKKQYYLPTVEYRLINGHIGYIAIRDFFTNVTQEVDNAMRDLYSKGANSWVFDVRGNPGGVKFDEVAGRFVKGGEIMGYDANRTDRSEVKVSNNGLTGPDRGKPFSPQLPMALLVDENSGSASEIVALVFRDFKLGPLVGKKTAGALGYSQAFALGDGTSISVTVREYESKNGEKLNGVGISPDVEVDMTVEDMVAGRDPQLAAAINQVDTNLASKNP